MFFLEQIGFKKIILGKQISEVILLNSDLDGLNFVNYIA